jgi:hypothetical protein
MNVTCKLSEQRIRERSRRWEHILLGCERKVRCKEDSAADRDCAGSSLIRCAFDSYSTGDIRISVDTIIRVEQPWKVMGGIGLTNLKTISGSDTAS